MARHDDYVQDLATRKTLIVSAYAAALAVAPLTQQFGMPFLPRLVIVGISFFGALAIRYRYADARRAGFFTETELFFVFGLLTVLAAELLALVPTLGKILGGITLLRAWYGWSVGCRQFPFSVSFSKLS